MTEIIQRSSRGAVTSRLSSSRISVVTFLLVASVIGCSTQSIPKADYARYIERMPASIVVVPPLNDSAQVRASEAFLSTITVPLAERGYYVFPVALVHGMLRENGLPTAGEMNQVPPQKFRDVFGADAVLFISIKEWTNRYIVIDSTTTVRLEYRLVDTTSGDELWRRTQAVQDSSNQGNASGDPVGVALAALIGAAIHAASDVNAHREHQLAIQGNSIAISNPNQGMLLGKRHKDFEKDQQQHKDDVAQALASASRNP